MIVVGTNITMTRGDSESILITMRNTESEIVPFISGDTVYWTVKENLNTENKALQKVVTEFENGNALINIEPKDTRELRPKEYVYDIQLTRGDGSVTTIIKPSKFTLEGDVTHE